MSRLLPIALLLLSACKRDPQFFGIWQIDRMERNGIKQDDAGFFEIDQRSEVALFLRYAWDGSQFAPDPSPVVQFGTIDAKAQDNAILEGRLTPDEGVLPPTHAPPSTEGLSCGPGGRMTARAAFPFLLVLSLAAPTARAETATSFCEEVVPEWRWANCGVAEAGCDCDCEVTDPPEDWDAVPLDTPCTDYGQPLGTPTTETLGYGAPECMLRDTHCASWGSYRSTDSGCSGEDGCGGCDTGSSPSLAFLVLGLLGFRRKGPAVRARC